VKTTTFTIELIKNHRDDIVESVNNVISTFGTISKFSRYAFYQNGGKRNLLFSLYKLQNAILTPSQNKCRHGICVSHFSKSLIRFVENINNIHILNNRITKIR